jgi:excinuclease UvrABC nuclease subunit
MKTIKLTDPEFWHNVPEEPGVYMVLNVTDSGKPSKLNRLLNIDENGILYIGKSSNLRDRLRMLWRTIQPDLKATAHTFGRRYKEISTLHTAYPISSLAITFSLVENPDKEESNLLRNYCEKFGEVPPFNSSISNK